MEWRFRSVKWKDCGVTVRHKDKQVPTARDCEDVLYLRVGCSNHEPGHLPQPRRRSEMREVTKSKRAETHVRYSNAKRAEFSLSSSLRVMRKGVLAGVQNRILK